MKFWIFFKNRISGVFEKFDLVLVILRDEEHPHEVELSGTRPNGVK